MAHLICQIYNTRQIFPFAVKRKIGILVQALNGQPQHVLVPWNNYGIKI